jgi:hypothetical protein
MSNLTHWKLLSRPPQSSLKIIEFGYLKGKSDINPQWRLMAMTEAFGVVGHGWNWRIVRTWSEVGGDGQIMCFSEVAAKVRIDGVWGEEFSGIGGSVITELAKGVLKSNDEGYKMATTDALGVAFKSLGVAADIYLGNYDGSKYNKGIDTALAQQPKQQLTPATHEIMEKIRNALMNGTTKERILARPYAFTAEQLAEINGFKGVSNV